MMKYSFVRVCVLMCARARSGIEQTQHLTRLCGQVAYL